jgi:hypothetical protein
MIIQEKKLVSTKRLACLISSIIHNFFLDFEETNTRANFGLNSTSNTIRILYVSGG